MQSRFFAALSANPGKSKMGKLGWSAILVVLAAIAADRYFNQGYYTDGGLAMLRQIRYSFGW